MNTSCPYSNLIKTAFSLLKAHPWVIFLEKSWISYWALKTLPYVFVSKMSRLPEAVA